MKTKPIIWREVKRTQRQWFLQIIPLIAVIAYAFFLGNYSLSIPYVVFLIFPLFFVISSAGGVFSGDMITGIESLISTPVTIKSIIIQKSIMIEIKSYMFSLVTGLALIAICVFTAKPITFHVSVFGILCILLLSIWNYSLCRLYGVIIWSVSKSQRILLYIPLYLVMSGIYMLLLFQKEGILFGILAGLSLFFYFVGSRYITRINKEQLIERSQSA